MNQPLGVVFGGIMTIVSDFFPQGKNRANAKNQSPQCCEVPSASKPSRGRTVSCNLFFHIDAMES